MHSSACSLRFPFVNYSDSIALKVGADEHPSTRTCVKHCCAHLFFCVALGQVSERKTKEER